MRGYMLRREETARSLAAWLRNLFRPGFHQNGTSHNARHRFATAPKRPCNPSQVAASPASL